MKADRRRHRPQACFERFHPENQLEILRDEEKGAEGDEEAKNVHRAMKR